MIIELNELLAKDMDVIIDQLTVRVEYAYFGWFAMVTVGRFEGEKFRWGIQHPLDDLTRRRCNESGRDDGQSRGESQRDPCQVLHA